MVGRISITSDMFLGRIEAIEPYPLHTKDWINSEYRHYTQKWDHDST
jgi:hypothetical protein